MAIVSGKTETQNLFVELQRLWKERGPRQLWTGTDASLLLVSNPIIQFVCYEQVKRMLLASKARKRQSGKSTTRPNIAIPTESLGPAEAFAIAALAKAIATVTTYPLQLSQTLLRLSNNKNRIGSGGDEDSSRDSGDAANTTEQQKQQYSGTMDCLIQLYRSDAGFAALFTGMRAKLLQTVLTAAFTFLTYEQILGVVKNVALRTMGMRQNRIGEGGQKAV
jgi:adenine nucleotide transporter 17